MNDDGVAELQHRFPRYSFRAFPDGRCECLRWQCGVVETERRIVSVKIATGHRAVEILVECFRLVAYASTASELAKKLAKLPAPPPRAWQELIG